MANSFSRDILIQAENPQIAADFYVKHLGFEITDRTPTMVSVCGENISLFIEQGPALGPVLEVTVDNVEKAKIRLMNEGCIVLKDEPEFPRCYLKDAFGLIYNLKAI
jgi:hypothetical protein